MITHSNRYSPKVELTLQVGDRRVELSRVGPSEIVVRDECEPIPPSNAKLIVTIDDESETYNIYLPHGIPAAPQRVAYI
jgi:hypothetical protein